LRTIIKNNNDFQNWLTSSDKDFELKRYLRQNYSPPDGKMVHIIDATISDIIITERNFECTEFKNCTFKNCDITHLHIVSCTLDNCKFIKCTFTWSKFLDFDLFDCEFIECVILGLEIGDAVIRNSKFIDCSEVLDLALRAGRDRDLIFQNCYLAYMKIEPIEEEFNDKLLFKDCLIKESNFDRINLEQSNFENCNLSINQFSACTFSNSTFTGINDSPGNEYNLIDIRTILNSPTIDTDILNNVFGINSSDIKEYLIDLTSKIEFQSIFISYSFEDSEFAKHINSELKRRGIFTFLWEKDAPGGKQLNDIMSSGIKEKDRILFIASKNSLKSKACQYELSEGRKKQEKTWEDVLFPIHIDNFLFEIKKENIRPVNLQDDYWDNIDELRRLNSLSFCEFKDSEKRDNSDFEKQILKLLKGLRKEK